jgi:hypothetical protein
MMTVFVLNTVLIVMIGLVEWRSLSGKAAVMLFFSETGDTVNFPLSPVDAQGV